MSAVMKEKYKDGNNPFRGKKHKQSTKDEISRLAIERWTDEEYKKKMHEIFWNENRRQKISNSAKQKWQDPEYRSKMLEWMNTEEYRKKISARNKGRKHTPEELKKMSERMTGEANAMFGKHGEDNPNSKPVIQFDLEGNRIKEYAGAMEAYYETGISNASIGECCKRKLVTAGGYIWRYPGDEEIDIPLYYIESNLPVYQFDKEANLINKYVNISEAAEVNGFSKYRIIAVCRGQAKSAHGFIWSFDDMVNEYKISNSKSRVILMFDKDGEWLDEFESLKHAERITGFSSTSILDSCKGRNKNHRAIKKQESHVFLFE